MWPGFQSDNPHRITISELPDIGGFIIPIRPIDRNIVPADYADNCLVQNTRETLASFKLGLAIGGLKAKGAVKRGIKLLLHREFDHRT